MRPETAMRESKNYRKTPDQRYFIVSGRLWRSTDPTIPDARRQELVTDLMNARRAVKDAKRGKGQLSLAREAVDKAKIALGERGPPWWNDGAPDFNQHLIQNTPYAAWFDALGKSESES